jgi:hypothetical protein
MKGAPAKTVTGAIIIGDKITLTKGYTLKKIEKEGVQIVNSNGRSNGTIFVCLCSQQGGCTMSIIKNIGDCIGT